MKNNDTNKQLHIFSSRITPKSFILLIMKKYSTKLSAMKCIGFTVYSVDLKMQKQGKRTEISFH